MQLRDGLPILLAPDPQPLDPALRHAAEQTRDRVRAHSGVALAIERPARAEPGAPGIHCTIDPQAALRPRAGTARDGYRLRIRADGARRPGHVELAAPDPAGLRYGLQTLAQLVDAKGRLPALEIVDQPDFRDRGIMLDVSRGRVPTHATLEDLVDLCARLRLNVLMLYVEHPFAFRRHPEIGAGSDPLDAETILALDAYAAERGVELVPCLQSLGHMERVLSLERYADLAESERRWSLSPSEPGTYALLGELYDEFLPLFRSRRFNANCDEPFDLGRGRSAERAPRKTPDRLFADHVRQLEKLAARHDKQLMIWADFPLKQPAALERIGTDVVMLDWWYEAEFDADRIRGLRRRGYEVWACPGTSSWNALFPRVENAARNVARWAAAGRRHGATGLLDTDWGDFGHYNALGASLQGYAWSAQQAWSGEPDPAAFDRAFAREVFGRDAPRIAGVYRKLGAIHDPGFTIANGSAIQAVYFDGLSRSFFLQHARRRSLETSRRRLEGVRREVEALGLDAGGDDFVGLAEREIAWSCEATGLAIEKGLAAIDYNAWRAEPGTLAAAGRRRLAKRLDAIAERQFAQLSALEALWLARSRAADFDRTRKRIRRSVADLRAGARRLRANDPPRPPRPTELTLLAVYDEVRRAYGLPPR